MLGERMPVFAHRPRSMRELLVESGEHGAADYVVCDDVRLRYDEHRAQVAAVSAILADEYGVGTGDRVALLAANHPGWIVGFWAATSMGAIAASMNAWWAEPEIEHAMRSAEPTVVLADRERASRLPSGIASQCRVIEIEEELADVARRGRGAELSDAPIAEDDPAVILYTSGTTGRSKGAVASHRSLCGTVSMSRHAGAQALEAMRARGIEAPSGAARTVALVTVPLFHASGVYGFVIGQLASGGTVVLRRGRFDAEPVIRLIEAEQVTMWAALGSMGPRVAARAAEIDCDLSSVRVLAIGGAPVSPATQEQLRAAFPNASQSVSMGYTSSEAVAVVTRNGGQELLDHPTSAGRVTATTALEIRDEHGDPVPEGVDGEIHVRSPYVMLGYWRDPEATAEVLKPGRWLAMGDVGQMRDGRLYINARARDLILVNAENVFPTEVEYRLDEHPDVVESAVFGVDDALTGQAIRAAVVVRPSSSVTTDELAAWCRGALAGYKVPTRWDLRSEPLPRNPSGKILKRALR